MADTAGTLLPTEAFYDERSQIAYVVCPAHVRAFVAIPSAGAAGTSGAMRYNNTSNAGSFSGNGELLNEAPTGLGGQEAGQADRDAAVAILGLQVPSPTMHEETWWKPLESPQAGDSDFEGSDSTATPAWPKESRVRLIAFPELCGTVICQDGATVFLVLDHRHQGQDILGMSADELGETNRKCVLFAAGIPFGFTVAGRVALLADRMDVCDDCSCAAAHIALPPTCRHNLIVPPRSTLAPC